MLRMWPTEVGVKTGWLAGLMVLLSGLFHVAVAQDYCDPAQRSPSTEEGGFTVAKRVCLGDPVTVTNTKQGATAIKYIYGYTKDSSLATAGTARTTFTFTKPGIYKILQAGSVGATGMLHCEEVQVLAKDPVKFTAQACIGRRATVSIDASTLGQYDRYLIRWGDGVSEEKSRTELQASPSHTYNSGAPNSPTITVEGVYGTAAAPLCSGSSTSQTITLLAAATQPTITALTTINDKTIELKYQTSAGITVQLYQKIGGVYTPTGQKGTSGGTFTVQTDTKQVQCFQLVPEDACNSQTAKSDEVCSLILTAQAANKQNNLKWQAYAGTTPQFRFYRILRNNAPSGPTITSRGANTISYADANAITCGSQYCYNIEARVDGTAQTVITSNQVCVTGINVDPPGEVGNIVVSIEDGKPRLVTIPPPGIGPTDSFTMIVSRASGASGNFQPVASLERKSTYTDDSANPSAGSYCYQVVYQTSCGLQTAPSKPVCTVFLDAKSTKGIDWTAESPFAPGTVESYIVEVIDSLNGTKQEIQLGANTHYEPDPNDPNIQSQKYRIIAVTAGGTVSLSNFYYFRREARIMVPDAFTPNGDGMNDTFLAFGIYVDAFTMNIYNRWGEVVYNTTNRKQGWDGTINGQQAPAGQYMYRIEVIDLTGLKTVRTGALLLIR